MKTTADTPDLRSMAKTLMRLVLCRNIGLKPSARTIIPIGTSRTHTELIRFGRTIPVTELTRMVVFTGEWTTLPRITQPPPHNR